MSSNILGLFWERKTNLLNLEQLKAKQTTLKSFSLSLFQEFSCKYYSRQKSFFFFNTVWERNGLLSIALSTPLSIGLRWAKGKKIRWKELEDIKWYEKFFHNSLYPDFHLDCLELACSKTVTTMISVV